MYIFFHGLVFEPEELIVAQSNELGLTLQFRGCQNPVGICCSEDDSFKLLGELYQMMLETGIAMNSKGEDPDFNLDDDELSALDLAAEAGYKWIARDKDHKLFCYQHKPEKVGNEYQDSHTPDPRRMITDWFSEITFDTGPISIDFLRLGG